MKIELHNSLGKLYLTTEFDTSNGWVYNDWKGIISNESIIEGCHEILKVQQDAKCPLMLNDNRQLVNSWGPTARWIDQVWLPQAMELGLRRFAHLVSPGIMGQASAAEFFTLVNSKIEMQLFEDLEQAKTWLHAA